jgi:flagellar assembly factor FliW
VDLSSPDALEAAIKFPQGLVGCEAWKSFVLLVSDEEDLPVATLQSLEDHAVTLMVADPKMILTDYTARLGAADREFLGLESGAEPVLLTTLTVNPDGWLTANLLGPLAA